MNRFASLQSVTLLLARLVLCVLAGLSAGCEPERGSSLSQTSRARPNGGASSGEDREDHLKRATDFLFALDTYEFEPASAQITYHLNRWIENQQAPTDWMVDPLVTDIPPRIRRATAPLRILDQLRFETDDVRYLQESVWLWQIANWSTSTEADEPFREWLEQAEEKIGRDQARQLAVAERLFDWTVRNVQLDETPPYPTVEVAGPGVGGADSQQASLLPPQKGAPGPGYTMAPWEALLRGHGDSLLRARIFILLARQQGLDAVMLGLYNKANPSLPRPWTPAVFLGGQLYLFDTELGLPIPDAQGGGVATLAQVLDSPDILESLDVGQNLKYAVRPDDLQNLTALIDAPPQSLSLRMQMLSSHLVGEQQAAITAHPSPLADRLRKCRGIDNVRLWVLPYETDMYRKWLDREMQTNQQLRSLYYQQSFVFMSLNPLVQGRFQHFRGAFGENSARRDEFEDENQQEKPGAMARYMEMRVPQSVVEEIPSSKDLQQQFGLAPLPGEDPGRWQNRLMSSLMMFAHAKLHASYWMGLAQYESGNYGAAVEWLQGRTLDATPDGPWTGGARYNLARCYERLGRVEDARKLYLSDDSPQRHGNLLRARRLRLAAQEETPPEAEAEQR